ncbi:MAG: PASTA domain-containing protein, partial [Clostridiales bacterium]|nr:PASTA domain-containing protein [Clostridiales bacterium]
MLYEMLTGRLPFQAESAVSVAIMQLQTEPQLPREINGSIPLGLEQITMHAMQKDQQKRYQSAAQVLQDLEAFKRDPSITFRYSYFVDNSPTRYVGGQLPGTEEQSAVEEEEEEPRRSPLIPALAGIAAAFILTVVLLSVFLLPRLFGSSGAELACPSFVGQSFDAIKANPEYAELNINPVSYDYNNQYEAGKVYKQEPDPGRSIKKKSTIKVWVSTGKKSLSVPDVYGLDSATAISSLRSHGLTVVTVETPDEDTAKDRVVKTVPARGDSIAEGGEVTIYVSQGPPVTYVDLPSLVGLNVEDAKRLILEKGLTIGSVSKVDSTSPANLVISQDPNNKDKKQVAQGSAVNMTVSTGVPPQTEPTEYTADLEIKLPDDYETSVYTVSAWLDGEEIKSVKVDSSQRHSYTFTLTSANETASVQIKIEGKPYLDYTVNFKESSAKLVKTYTYTPASTPSGSGEED